MHTYSYDPEHIDHIAHHHGDMSGDIHIVVRKSKPDEYGRFPHDGPSQEGIILGGLRELIQYAKSPKKTVRIPREIGHNEAHPIETVEVAVPFLRSLVGYHLIREEISRLEDMEPRKMFAQKRRDGDI
jgi:hypothetical protein